MICKICNKEITADPFEVKEMMLGLKTRHTYYECADCEALQIETVPADPGRYYPDDYYSFSQHPESNIGTTFLRKQQSGYLLYNRNSILGPLLSIGYKVPDYIEWARTTGVGYDDAILDTGSGSGDILSKYCRAGFTNLHGIDPFLKQEFTSANGKLKLLRKSLFDVQVPATFDLVMLHHSLEHMDAPKAVFQRLAELVKPGKYLLIRTPVNKSFSSKKYKTDWVDWDPPRHLVVHSRKSMQLLAEKNGFELEKVVYDSTASQFWGSEQYIKGISLHDPQSYAVNKKTTLFTKSQIKEWEQQAAELNKKGEGDQACFYLKKK
jgi:SAM-dependent methyltransferase